MLSTPMVAPAADTASPPPTSDEPVSILAALVDVLMQPERYNIVTRDGELVINPLPMR
jgi:hypothetical protein